MLAQGQDIIPSMVIAMVKVFLRLFEPAFVVLIQFCFCVPLDLWISMSEKSLSYTKFWFSGSNHIKFWFILALGVLPILDSNAWLIGLGCLAICEGNNGSPKTVAIVLFEWEVARLSTEGFVAL